MKITFSRAIIFGTIVAAVLSMAAITGFSYYSSRTALVANAGMIMDVHARNIAQQTSGLLAPVPLLAEAIRSVAESSSPLDHTDKNYRFFVEKLKDLSNIYSVYWSDPNGQFFLVGRRPMGNDPFGPDTFFLRTIRIASGKRTVSETWFTPAGDRVIKSYLLRDDQFDPRQRPWYKTAVTAMAPAWSDPYIFFITKKPGITYSIPLYRNGNLYAVCAVDLETDSLSAYLREILPTPSSRIFVLTGNGKIVGYSNPARLVAQQKSIPINAYSISDLGDDVVTKTSTLPVKTGGNPDSQTVGHGVIKTGGNTYHTLIVSSIINGLPLRIGLSIPEREYFFPLIRSHKATLLFSLAIMVVAIVGGLFFSRSLSLPMMKLRQAAEAVEQRNFDTPMEFDSRFEEVEMTFAAFRQMQSSIRGYVAETRQLNEYLQTAHLGTLYRLAVAAEYKDRDTATHLNRVASCSRLLGIKVGLSTEEVDILFHASLMHDVGKIGIPDGILLKPGLFTEEERMIMEEHTVIGGKILADPNSKVMEAARVIALSHHEWWNGTGYPLKLAGDEIPLWGRIVAIADVMDSLLSKRPYKKALSFQESISLIAADSGSHFDPRLVKAVLDNANDFLAISEISVATEILIAPRPEPVNAPIGASF